MKPSRHFFAAAAIVGLSAIVSGGLTRAFTSTPRMAEALRHQHIFEQMHEAFAAAELKSAKRRNPVPALPKQP